MSSLFPGPPRTPTPDALVSRFSVSGVSGWSWIEGLSPSRPGDDNLLIAPLDSDRLRLAAFDPVDFPAYTHADSQVALGTITGLLRSGGDIVTALHTANSLIHDPDLPTVYDNPMTAVAAVDIDLASRTLFAVRASDCEVWALTDGEWIPLFPTDILTPAARATYNAHLDAVADRDADYQLHVTHRSSPDEWNTAPIGLFSPPKLELATIAGPVDAVVVSTDGAELSAEVLPTLDDWLSSHLQNRTPRPPHRYPHGDLAVVAVDLTGDNTPQA